MKFFSSFLSIPFIACLTLSTTPLRAQDIAGNFVIKLEPNAYSLESTRSMANSVNPLLEFEKIVLQSSENNNSSLACKLQIFSTFRTHHRGAGCDQRTDDDISRRQTPSPCDHKYHEHANSQLGQRFLGWSIDFANKLLQINKYVS